MAQEVTCLEKEKGMGVGDLALDLNFPLVPGSL